MLDMRALPLDSEGLTEHHGYPCQEAGVITDQRAEEAFEYLRDTTDQIGAAKGELERAEILRKRVRKKWFLDAKGTSVAEREAIAEGVAEVEKADDRYVTAITAFESLRAKRDIETIALECWRTECANRRRA